MNYFNYFTEIEEHFQRKRGARQYLSPVDWALIETWREAGVPLAAVLAGIDQAFEKFEAGRRRDTQRPRALVYCAAAVLAAHDAMRAAAVGASSAPGRAQATDDAFRPERLRLHLEAELRRLGARSDLGEVRAGLEALLAGPELPPLEDLDRWLTVLDAKVLRALEDAVAVDEMVALRAELDRELAPYRRAMRAEQLALVERQFLQRKLLERAGLRRLSLFYMG